MEQSIFKTGGICVKNKFELIIPSHDNNEK